MAGITWGGAGVTPTYSKSPMRFWPEPEAPSDALYPPTPLHDTTTGELRSYPHYLPLTPLD